MIKPDTYHLETEIDSLTNCIREVISGNCFDTDILEVDSKDIRLITKRNGWLFDWNKEHKLNDRTIYKLVIRGNTPIIQGLVSISIMDNHIHLNIVESAPFNRGARKLYEGVGGNLFAFCCKKSFDTGYEGIITFVAKTKLIKHYKEQLGAKTISGNKMVILTEKALFLTNKYFKQ